jgi:hypothetical protein
MQSIHTLSATGDHTADILKQVIVSERAVVALYAQALKGIKNCSCTEALAKAMHCHKRRADLLAGEVRRLGARAYQAAPSWRAFAYVVGSTTLEEVATVAALAASETNLSAQYDTWHLNNDFGVQCLMRELHPLQAQTVAAINNLLAGMTEHTRAA